MARKPALHTSARISEKELAPIRRVFQQFSTDRSETTLSELTFGCSVVKPIVRQPSKPTQPSVLTDQYGWTLLIGKQIGKGGYSKCYTATTLSGKVFAVKTISREPVHRKVTRAHIEREALIHQSLSHPSIVGLKEVIADDVRMSLVLDYCTNNTLFELIASVGRVPETTMRAIMRPVLEAVEYLHENLIHHGDLKLSNIFMDSEWNPKIGDFGFSKQLTSFNEVRRRMCGTPAYMAPEVIMRPCEFGLPADIWSLGVVTYALLYGTTAFDAKRVNEVYMRILTYDLQFPPKIVVGEETVYLMRWMLCRRPCDRPTARQLAKMCWKEGAPVARVATASSSSDGSDRTVGECWLRGAKARVFKARCAAELKSVEKLGAGLCIAVKSKLARLRKLLRKRSGERDPTRQASR